MSDDDDYPHDHETGNALPNCRPDAQMSSLEQLQKYQFILRNICPHLDSFESNVLMQIVDRTAGWKKHATRLPLDVLYGGDPTVYGGLTRQMHLSRMKKALQTLERRGVINRIAQPYYPTKIYRVNYDVDLEQLEASAPEERQQGPVSNRDPAVSLEDELVQEVHFYVCDEDGEVSDEDPIEGYSENSISNNSNITRQRLVPTDPIAARSPAICEGSGETDGPFPAEPRQPEINPRRRTRRAPS